ncbi:MAG: hypothetical protein ACLFOY_11340 [Desulfatibacillaceae bacterium]
MATEDNIWVLNFLPRLEESLGAANLLGVACRVMQGVKLPYACEITEYEDSRPRRQIMPSYLADLVVADVRANDRWVPRVVLECRARQISPYAALNHDMKAEAHKRVHPYLRYGLLLGKQHQGRLSGRVLRHGSHLDFMMVWQGLEPSDGEWDRFVRVLAEEVEASRRLEVILKGRSTINVPTYTVMRRKLDFE